jgi:hypothetical protein
MTQLLYSIGRGDDVPRILIRKSPVRNMDASQNRDKESKRCSACASSWT